MKSIGKHIKWILMLALLGCYLGAVPPLEVLGSGKPNAAAAGQTNRRRKIKYYRISMNHTFHVRMGQTLKSDTAHVGDTFTTTVVDPVYSTNGVELVPNGSIISGRVSFVQKAQKDGKPGALGVDFNRLKLPNGRSVAINGSLTNLDSGSTTSDNEGTAQAKKTSKRNLKFIGGGAAGGAVIGAIAGGGKGLAIGSAVGAGVGFLGKKLMKGKNAEVKEGTEFGVILNQSVSLPAYRPS